MYEHLVFLLDCPYKGKTMLFPGSYERLKDEIDAKYELVENFDITTVIGWSTDLAKHEYKVFRKKTKSLKEK